MIINTIILFLRDLLPIFILFCYLSVLIEKRCEVKRERQLKMSLINNLFNKKQSYQLWLITMLIGILSALLLANTAEYIADWFNGTGLEIISTSLLILMFHCLIYAVYLLLKTYNISDQIMNKMSFFIITGCSLFIAEKGSSFFIFFNVYMQQTDNVYNTIIGCFVGLGLCISFSILFRFILNELVANHYTLCVFILWSLFLAGQVTGAVNYLSQVDLITEGAVIIHLGQYINDSSELGHILKALIGYESSPTLTFIVCYLVAFLLSFIFSYFYLKHSSHSIHKSYAL